MQLFYHKCNDCLTAFSSTEKKIDLCDCNGSVKLMGEVHGNKFIKTEDRPACDGRCTHACGPSCDCACGGANHGTGKVVQVVVAEGLTKAVGLTEEDVERATMYRGLRDHAEKLYTDAFSTYDRAKYSAKIRARRELDHAISLKVHVPRINALIKFITNNQPKKEEVQTHE